MTREDFGLEAREPESASDYKVLTIKQRTREEQPRERAMLHGIQALTTAELLAIILRTGLPGVPITDLCRQLMSDNEGSLLRLEQRTRNELMLTPGIGEAKALQIEAMMEIMRRYLQESIDESTRQIDIINTSSTINERMRFKIANLDHEEVWIVLLNRRNQVIKEFRVSSGSSSASVFDVKMIIKRALLENAEGIIMCHNHPSGNLRPSPQDDNITRKLSEGCKALDIKMLDHVIIATSGYYSYRDQGHL